MLQSLTIDNLLIVARASLDMGEGLTVISGETGAGKSLLLDALHLVLGGRGGAGMVGPLAEQCMVTAVFSLADDALTALAETTGLDVIDGDCILRRRITRQGRSQAWVNDVPVSIGTLKQIGARLVDIRVQHEHLRLADVARQLELLDRYGDHEALAAQYVQAHQACLELASEIEHLEQGDADSLKELDYLRFLVAEIEQLAPRAGELAELVERQRLLAGVQEWRELCAETTGLLLEQDAALVPLVGELHNRLLAAPQEELRNAADCLGQAADLLREAGLACAATQESLQADPEELARVDERLGLYHDLMRKHGGDEEHLLATFDRHRERIAFLDNLDARRAELSARLEATRTERARLGQDLADRRREVFVALRQRVHDELAVLGMPKAELLLQEQELDEPGPHGSTTQEFWIVTNPGLPAGRLAEVASGGESARVTLALAVALADQDDTPVLVFDEVDSGVGGRLGSIMGEQLARLGQGRSVVAVTHTPQLAARAQQHFLVAKDQGDAETSVGVIPLTGERRLAELADMLGGGKAALRQAEELLAAGACAGGSAADA